MQQPGTSTSGFGGHKIKSEEKPTVDSNTAQPAKIKIRPSATPYKHKSKIKRVLNRPPGRPSSANSKLKIKLPGAHRPSPLPGSFRRPRGRPPKSGKMGEKNRLPKRKPGRPLGSVNKSKSHHHHHHHHHHRHGDTSLEFKQEGGPPAAKKKKKMDNGAGPSSSGPIVNGSAAVATQGTSVSPVAVASGSRPLHNQLGMSASPPTGRREPLPAPPPPETRAFWRPPESAKPLLDQVLITDVTTGDNPSVTITIRESTTDAGFFKNRGSAEA